MTGFGSPAESRVSRFLGKETREPLPPRPGAVERFDHVYTRQGVASLFLAFEPLGNWRTVGVTDRRRCVEGAEFIRELLEGRYARAEKVVLVLDARHGLLCDPHERLQLGAIPRLVWGGSDVALSPRLTATTCAAEATAEDVAMLLAIAFFSA